MIEWIQTLAGAFLSHQQGQYFGDGFLTATRKGQSHDDAVFPGQLTALELKDLADSLVEVRF